VLPSPELHQLLVRRLGWDRNRYGVWLAERLAAFLFQMP
jgi:hypothetical protein